MTADALTKELYTPKFKECITQIELTHCWDYSCMRVLGCVYEMTSIQRSLRRDAS